MEPSDRSPERPAQRDSFSTRLAAKILPVLVYTLVFPTILFFIPKIYLDPWLDLPPLFNQVSRWVLGGILIIPGAFFALWSVKAQREIGKGTPMPLMPTQKLVVQGPYAYCRNPMFLGILSIFFGISTLLNSTSSLVIVLAFSIILLVFVKFMEEKELGKRFGEDYLAYKEKTSFIVPIPPQFRREK